jgi:hypothetical protein
MSIYQLTVGLSGSRQAIFQIKLGTQRNRLLTTLFKDERCISLIGYSILKNMYLERLVKNSEVCLFGSFS